MVKYTPKYPVTLSSKTKSYDNFYEFFEDINHYAIWDVELRQWVDYRIRVVGRILKVRHPSDLIYPIKLQRRMVTDDLDNISQIPNPNLEIQRYVLDRKPTLISKIHNPNYILLERYINLKDVNELGII